MVEGYVCLSIRYGNSNVPDVSRIGVRLESPPLQGRTKRAPFYLGACLDFPLQESQARPCSLVRICGGLSKLWKSVWILQAC